MYGQLRGCVVCSLVTLTPESSKVVAVVEPWYVAASKGLHPESYRWRINAYLVAPETALQLTTGWPEAIVPEMVGDVRVTPRAIELYHLYQDGNISGRGFAERNASLEERLEQLDNEIPKLQADVDFLKIEFLTSGEALAAAQDLQARWPRLSRDEKRGVVEAITDRIVVRDNEIDIMLSYVPNAAKPPPIPNWKDRAKSPHTLASRRNQADNPGLNICRIWHKLPQCPTKTNRLSGSLEK